MHRTLPRAAMHMGNIFNLPGSVMGGVGAMVSRQAPIDQHVAPTSHCCGGAAASVAHAQTLHVNLVSAHAVLTWYGHTQTCL